MQPRESNFVSFAFLPTFLVLKNKHKRNNFQTNEGEVNHFMDFKKVDDVFLGRKKNLNLYYYVESTLDDEDV